MPDIPPGTKVIDLRQAAQRISGAWDSLFGRRFSPGMPIQPTDKQPSLDGPRQYQYPVGVNMNFGAPRMEDPMLGLTPFDQLRALASLYDVAAMCIATRIEEVQGLKWSVVAKDKRRQKELQSECDEIEFFFKQPDKLNDFNAWLGMILYELFSTDAATLYKRKSFNGELYGLDVVDGTTIKPLLDDRGRTLAYQQILYGYPESQFDRPYTEAPDEQLPIFAPNELMYKPRWTRSFTPYGFPPTEWIIIRMNTAIRKQAYDLAYFTDGNIPDMIAWPPEGMLDPKQVQDFEIWYNSVLAGNDAARRKMRFVPWPANIKELRPFTYDTALDFYMLKVTCAAYAVPPMELGFTEDVNRASGQIQEAVNERRGLKPLVSYMKAAIFDEIIQNDMKKPYLEMNAQFGDKVDDLIAAQSDQVYVMLGVVSPNEVRTMRFGDILDGEAPGPPQPAMPPGMPGEEVPSTPTDFSSVPKPVPPKQPVNVSPYNNVSVNGSAQKVARGLPLEQPFRKGKGWEDYG